MFDYENFENELVLQMEHTLKKCMEENDDIYIFSLDCARGADSIGIISNTAHYLAKQADTDSEDYWYYKYCEEEWELFESFHELSASMRTYLAHDSNKFTDPETNEYTAEFDQHLDMITETCKKALYRFKQIICKDYPELLLAFNIQEYLDGEERIDIFEKLNGRAASLEYSEHIDDFA